MDDLTKPIRSYYPEIDFIKAFAILSVVILHILTFNGDKNVLYNFFASFHIWQAVPLFMLIFGFTFRLSVEKNHSIGKIFTSRAIRLVIPLFVTYIISFIPIFIFDVNIEIDWHIFIGMLPTNGMGNYFITLYIETMVYFTIFYYLVKQFNKYFIILFSVFISIIGELISYTINISDMYMYSSSIHRYVLLIALGYYFYDNINNRQYNFILLGGVVSAMLLYIFNTSRYPIWPYSEYKSAVLWGFQHFPYAFYTIVFALGLIYVYRQIKYIFIEKIVMLIARSSFHIFLAQIFVFLIEKFYKIAMNIPYAFLTLVVSLIAGIIWYRLEELILKWATNNVD